MLCLLRSSTTLWCVARIWLVKIALMVDHFHSINDISRPIGPRRYYFSNLNKLSHEITLFKNKQNSFKVINILLQNNKKCRMIITHKNDYITMFCMLYPNQFSCVGNAKWFTLWERVTQFWLKFWEFSSIPEIIL